jgi:hypothetical protein
LQTTWDDTYKLVARPVTNVRTNEAVNTIRRLLGEAAKKQDQEEAAREYKRAIKLISATARRLPLGRLKTQDEDDAPTETF